jgi:uncharacterized protein YhhL (DUF1145 family)
MYIRTNLERRKKLLFWAVLFFNFLTSYESLCHLILIGIMLTIIIELNEIAYIGGGITAHLS